MFFPERVKDIKDNDLVLEIGPGATPHLRSDVLLELSYEDDNERYAQSGYAGILKTDKQIYFYDGNEFPFKNDTFDYIICSHVVEHLNLEKIQLFFSEMKRVGKKGYIEFPNVFYELINYQSQHISFMNYRNGIILFYDKQGFVSNYIHKTIREMFYGKDDYVKKTFSRYKDFYFSGFEWNRDDLKFEIVCSFDELVNDYDFNQCKKYFNNFTSFNHNTKPNRFYKIKPFLKKIKTFYFKKTNISKTAILENKKLIKIDSSTEIKEYVIIRTYKNKVEVGKNTQINPFTVIYGGAGVYIGDNVLIAPHCIFAAGDHDYKQLDLPMRFAGSINSYPINIKNDVWIGANCTVTSGVTVGEGAVIGANSIVTRDVLPYEIVGGCPIRNIGFRK